MIRVFEYDKEKAKREYNLRNAVFWGMFAGFIPVLAVFGSLLQGVFGLAAGYAYVGVPFVIGLVIVAFWRILWECPRCHNSFYMKSWYRNTFTTKCVHCGFRPNAQ